jgi:hypothetical protein
MTWSIPPPAGRLPGRWNDFRRNIVLLSSLLQDFSRRPCLAMQANWGGHATHALCQGAASTFTTDPRLLLALRAIDPASRHGRALLAGYAPGFNNRNSASGLEAGQWVNGGGNTAKRNEGLQPRSDAGPQNWGATHA